MTGKAIAVIGHVDHGKTALVKALTGIETDRLVEEKTRGLSIALGFACLGSENHLCHLIDTPGHADFIQTTARGLSGADAVLLVVSAQDGIAVQTRQYLRLAALFGIRRAVIAITKSDLVPDEQTEGQRAAIEMLLNEMGIRPADFISCSSVTGAGIPALEKALSQLDRGAAERRRLDAAFLAIDRVFTIDGVGTVVTGTLVGRRLEVGADIHLSSKREAVTVRGLQVAGQPVETAEPGHRVAVNLRGLDKADVQPGDVLSGIGPFEKSRFLDVVVLPGDDRAPALRHMEQVQVLIGTSALSARIRLLSRSNAELPENHTFAQLELSSPYTSFPGQRAVIRRPARAETIAGARVLDPAGSKVQRNKPAHVAVLRAVMVGSPSDVAVALSLRDRGCVQLSELSRLTNRPIEELERALEQRFIFEGRTLAFDRAEIARLEDRFLETLDQAQAARPLRPAVPVAEIQGALRDAPRPMLSCLKNQLLERGVLVEREQCVARKGGTGFEMLSDVSVARVKAIEAEIRARGLSPERHAAENDQDPDRADIEAWLTWHGRVLKLHNVGLNQTVLLHVDVVEAAKQNMLAAFGVDTAFMTGEVRELLNTNRKTIVPLLEHFDRLGVTLRTGDQRRMQACSQSEAS
jgi:selenocysteine-specific elongation factor